MPWGAAILGRLITDEPTQTQPGSSDIISLDGRFMFNVLSLPKLTIYMYIPTC